LLAVFGHARIADMIPGAYTIAKVLAELPGDAPLSIEIRGLYSELLAAKQHVAELEVELAKINPSSAAKQGSGAPPPIRTVYISREHEAARARMVARGSRFASKIKPFHAPDVGEKPTP
jgi:hypothetical protein